MLSLFLAICVCCYVLLWGVVCCRELSFVFVWCRLFLYDVSFNCLFCLCGLVCVVFVVLFVFRFMLLLIVSCAGVSLSFMACC